MRQLCLLTAFWLARAAMPAGAADANLLRNPSFEQAHPRYADTPAAWSLGKIYGNGPTHFELATQARSGGRSVRMSSLHVTQFVHQNLKLPEDARYTFVVHAKGSGKLRLYVQARKGAQALKGSAMGDSTLTDRWLPYEVSGRVPSGSDHVRFHVITPMTGCDVFLDDADVVIDRQPEADTDAVTHGRDGLCNITSLCSLRCVPFSGSDVGELCDGDTRWGGLRPEHRPGRGARFAFHFPRAVEVVGIDFVQTRPATSYLLDADTDGDGIFDQTLARVTGKGSSDWARHTFTPTRAHAVRFCGLQGPDRYGTCYPMMRELSIWAVREPWMAVPNRSDRSPTDVAELSPHGVPRSLPQVTRDLDTPMTERTARGVFIESWMFGLGKDTPPPFDGLRALDQFLWQLDYVGADHVTLFPHRTGTRCPVWPSKFVEGSPWDVLTPLVSALKDRRIRTFVIFGRHSKLLRPELPWPQWFGGLLAEVAARSAHGASICGDEFPQGGGGTPDPELYATALKQELGIDSKPMVREDTEAYRKWKLFHYRQIALSHRQAGDHALKVNPDFVFSSNWRIDPIALNQTYGVLAYDILGRETGISYFGTDPYYSDGGRRTYMERAVKLLAAAARPNGALPVLKGGSWDFDHLDRYPGILLNGSAIASVMHGAAGVSFYRLNYLFLNNKSHLVHEAFRMIEWLDAAGLRNTRIPRTVAVLHSRASEDFWQLRHELTLGADLKVDGIRGYVAQKLIEELLIQHNYPFEIHYLEREDELKELGQYELLVLPFPYCISDTTAAAVEDARQAGAKLLICERLGEANEIGTLRPKPILSDWRDRDRVTFIDNVLDEITDPAFRSQLLQTLDRLLGQDKPYQVWPYGQNVEVLLREGADGQRLLAAINWERHDAAFDVGLRLPEGSYRVTQCDGYGTRAAVIDGRRDLTAADLAKFRVELKRDQVRVYSIRSVQR